MVQDPVQSRLLELIEEKKKGMRLRPQEKPKAEPAPSNVVNIMDALRRSIAEGRRGGSNKAPSGDPTLAGAGARSKFDRRGSGAEVLPRIVRERR